MPGCKFRDLTVLLGKKWGARQDKRADVLADQHRKRALDLLRGSRFERQNFYIVRPGPDVLHRRGCGSVGEIHQKGGARECGHDAEQDLQQLGAPIASDQREPGNVAAGRARLWTNPLPMGSPTEIMNIGIVEVAFCAPPIAGVPTDDVHVELHKLGGHAVEALILAVAEAPVYGQVLALDIAEFAHGLREATKKLGIERNGAGTR